MNPHLYIFTDGSCGRPPDAIGGWGAVVISREHQQILSGTEYPTTISRCELHPVLASLRYIRGTLYRRNQLPAGLRIRLISDSEYLVKIVGGLNEPTKNEGLWAAYTELADGLVVEAVHRERQTYPLMQLADSLAYSAYSTFKGHITDVKKLVGKLDYRLIEDMNRKEIK